MLASYLAELHPEFILLLANWYKLRDNEDLLEGQKHLNISWLGWRRVGHQCCYLKQDWNHLSILEEGSLSLPSLHTIHEKVTSQWPQSIAKLGLSPQNNACPQKNTTIWHCNIIFIKYISICCCIALGIIMMHFIQCIQSNTSLWIHLKPLPL